MALIIDRAVMGPFQVNTYLLMDTETRDAWIVDAGGDAAAVDAMVRRHGARVSAVAATHGHIDHVAGASPACEAYGVPFVMHAGDKSLVSSLRLQASMFGYPDTPVPKMDRFWNDWEPIEIGSCHGVVVPTPGHTPGGVCLWFERDGILLTGDTLFAGSVGRTDLPGGDGAQLLQSIRDRLYPLPGNPVFYPGHGGIGRLEHERRTNPFVRQKGAF